MSVPPLSPRPDPHSAPEAVFAEMLRAARALLAMRDPLDAEVGVSEMLGSWWARKMPGVDVERLFGEGLVTHAAESDTAAGLALLTGISALGTSRRQRDLAASAMRGLREQGLACPVWAESIGVVEPMAAYVSGSRFGDTDDIICTFRYADHASARATGTEHALIAVVDHNSGGILRDAWVTTKIDRLLRHCEEEADTNPMATLTGIAPGHARQLLEAALERTDRVLSGGQRPPGPAHSSGADDTGLAGGSLAAHHAMARARVRALPRDSDDPEPVWRRDDRATLAARFLASDEAAELSDSYAASRCVDHVISYGCDRDVGRPLRVSPRKVETFLLTWLPRRAVLLADEQEAMPHVLAAWIRWAGPRYGLPEVAVGATLDALWESTNAFATTYPDPASFGLRHDVIHRLLPDGDLSALPRRMFAFPLLTSDLLAETNAVEHFDPTTREGRRALLKLDHFGQYDAPEPRRGKHSAGLVRDTHDHAPNEEELAAHERLAERLWTGDPPALWNAAQRLLDQGRGRPEVLRALLDALAEAPAGEDALTKRLEEL